jgi:hypothetical protein
MSQTLNELTNPDFCGPSMSQLENTVFPERRTIIDADWLPNQDLRNLLATS